MNPVLPCQGCRYLATEYSFLNMQIKDKSEINIGDLVCKGERSTVRASFLDIFPQFMKVILVFMKSVNRSF